MWMDLDEGCIQECFDTFFGAVSSGKMMGCMGGTDMEEAKLKRYAKEAEANAIWKED